MEALPVRPPAPYRAPHRSPAAGAARRPAAAVAHAAAHPTVPLDPALVAKQRDFDQIMILQAEQEREANALRDLAMQQIKRDDQTMNEWIKLI
jgi:hypothetical protein